MIPLRTDVAIADTESFPTDSSFKKVLFKSSLLRASSRMYLHQKTKQNKTETFEASVPNGFGGLLTSLHLR